jgi:hypothetical protein
MTDLQTNRDSEQRTISPVRHSPQGWLSIRKRAIAQLRVCGKGGPLWRLSAPLNMEAEFSPLRRWLLGWLRLSLPLSLRGSTSPEGNQSPPQRRLRAWRFADIPTAPPGQNIVAVLVVTLSIFSASLALDACAIAAALAPQRFLTASATAITLRATGIASALATHRLIGSALAPQRFAVNRLQGWRSA